MFELGEGVQIFGVLRDVSVSAGVWKEKSVYIGLFSVDSQVHFGNERT
jgi:hypothetical protein